MAGETNLKIRGRGMAEITDALKLLIRREVLVGFPAETTERDVDPDAKPGDTPPTNAMLAYIHDNGAPEANIPQRQFMIPAMVDARSRLTAALAATGRNVLTGGGNAAVDQGLHRVGLIAQAALRSKINEGIPPPLADSTLRERANRGGKSKGRMGANWELAWRAAGAPAGVELAKPLVDTGQLRNAANYVIRDRKDRS